MDNPPQLYVVASGKSFLIRNRTQVFQRGTMDKELDGFEDRGLLASELTLALGLKKMPTVLQVIKGGLADVKLLVPTLRVIEPPPDGPRCA